MTRASASNQASKTVSPAPDVAIPSPKLSFMSSGKLVFVLSICLRSRCLSPGTELKEPFADRYISPELWPKSADHLLSLQAFLPIMAA